MCEKKKLFILFIPGQLQTNCKYKQMVLVYRLSFEKYQQQYQSAKLTERCSFIIPLFTDRRRYIQYLLQTPFISNRKKWIFSSRGLSILTIFNNFVKCALNVNKTDFSPPHLYLRIIRSSFRNSYEVSVYFQIVLIPPIFISLVWVVFKIMNEPS